MRLGILKIVLLIMLMMGLCLTISCDLDDENSTDSPQNAAPVLGAIADRSVDEEAELTFTITATDADGDSLIYSAADLPSGASFSGNTFTWTPANGQDGTYNVTLSVSDGSLTDNQSVTITVNDVNQDPPQNTAPELATIADRSVDEEAELTFTITATDADGDTLTYSAADLPSGASFSGNTFTWIPVNGQDGSYIVTFSASDGLITDNQAVTITVNDTDPYPLTTGAIIIDHASTDLAFVPPEWIEEAKDVLHIAYGHTSHGSQITTGMSGLIAFANNGGMGLDHPENTFTWSHDGSNGLHLFEGSGYNAGYLDHDCGYAGWDDKTRTFLDENPEYNVIIWSWCGQVNDYYSNGTLQSHYLDAMAQLETEYPGVIFIYMTGHAEGTGEEGSVHLANQMIRQYCIDNNKVLFDFYDIESYDPDGAYFGDLNVSDDCSYTGGNWATEWQNSHTEGVDWYSCSSAHSQPLNANLKAYAAWWLWARLAGWDGN